MSLEFSYYKKTWNKFKKKKIEIDEQNSEDIDHIGDDKTNSEEYASVLRQSSRGNIEIWLNVGYPLESPVWRGR